MKVMILGIDGYIGWALANKLKKEGHEVIGIDDLSRRKRVSKCSSDSLTPITNIDSRQNLFNINRFTLGSMIPSVLINILSLEQPDVIFHLAEQPSAAWSMRDFVTSYDTQSYNVLGTLQLLWAMKESCPSAHLIKLGTMGEYGTPKCDIPEGRIPENWCQKYEGDALCPMAGLLFPRTAGSFYHLSKVMDTINIEFACRTWGLTSTDIMQGVVFGLNNPTNEDEMTRFDYDECFGTVINRFCVQALADYPLTIYGQGGQTRGYLPLQDSLQCLTIAMENPPKGGEYRTLNQFAETFSIKELVEMVLNSCDDLNISCGAEHIPNPRIERESHYYNPHHQTLFDLGYEPAIDIQGEITKLITQLSPYKDRIITDVLNPKIQWR